MQSSPPRIWLVLALVSAVVLRMVLWGELPRIGFISDEGEYLAAATWLSYGRGFAWYLDYYWTRAPLYPLFVAAHLFIGGNEYWVYISQIILSLTHIVLVWAITNRLMPQQPAVSIVASMLLAINLPLATASQTLLSETLFLTFFLALLWLALIVTTTRYRRIILFMMGVCIGLAILTRSLALVFWPLLAAWVWATAPSHRWRDALILSVTAVLMVLPWSIYASRTFGGTIIVDTSGAYNLLLSANASVYGDQAGTQTDRFVDALSQADKSAPAITCVPHPGLLPTQGARQSAMTAEALCLIQANPSAFVSRIPAEFVSFWQIRYSSAERFTKGFTIGNVSQTYADLLLWLDDVWYLALLIPAVLGVWVSRRDVRVDQWWLLVIWVIVPVLLGAVLFSITRFRLILLPMVAILAAMTIVFFWQKRWRALLTPSAGVAGASALLLWSLAATPLAHMTAVVPPSFFGPSPSIWFCYDLTTQAQMLRANRDAFATLLQQPITRDTALPLPLPLPYDEVGQALLLQRTGDAQAALATLPATSEHIEVEIVRADMWRTLGQIDAARALLGSTPVEQRNPVSWSYTWLNPAPTQRIDVGDDLDLGYIDGCYASEYDATHDARLRWCGNGARIRFPQAADGFVQQLLIQVDGSAWPTDLLPTNPIEVWLGNQLLGTFAADRREPRVERFDLPVLAKTSTIEITLRGPEFVPDALDYRGQRGPLLGQMRRLMVRIDWAAVAPSPQ
ncbi:MAG: glycosyltransferase family 39 protein [Roseiflexaceae bacterium]